MATSSSHASGRSLLPSNVKPTNYYLELSPDLNSPTYDGKVSIDLDVLENSNKVSFHTLDIEIISVKLGDAGSSSDVQDYTDIT
jgi:aminopeptidase 2